MDVAVSLKLSEAVSDSFLQHKAGLLAKPAFESFVTGDTVLHVESRDEVVGGMATIFRPFWQRVSSGFVDSILRDTAIAPVPDAYAEWKRSLRNRSRPPEPRCLSTGAVEVDRIRWKSRTPN